MRLAQKLSLLKIVPIPAGWMTIQQLAKKEGYSCQESFRAVLRQAVAAKLVEQKKFRIFCPSGACRAIPHYRYLKP